MKLVVKLVQALNISMSVRRASAKARPAPAQALDGPLQAPAVVAGPPAGSVVQTPRPLIAEMNRPPTAATASGLAGSGSLAPPQGLEDAPVSDPGQLSSGVGSNEGRNSELCRRASYRLLFDKGRPGAWALLLLCAWAVVAFDWMRTADARACPEAASRVQFPPR